MKYSLGDIAQIVNGKAYGNKDEIIDSVQIDTRGSITGENPIFIAIKGNNHNGHDFIEVAYQKSIKSFLVSKLPKDYSNLFSNANFIVVHDTVVALQQWASYHRQLFDIPIIGITGSNGKTIVKEWLYQMLSPDFDIVRSPKSYNSQIGVPLSVLAMDKNHNLAIFEAGISQKGEMDNLQKIILPTIGILTNIGEAHSKNFENKEDKLKEKLLLFKQSNKLIFGSDNKFVYSIINDFIKNKNIKPVVWSHSQSNATIKILETKLTPSGIDVKLIFTHTQQTAILHIPFADEASFENSMHIITLMYEMGYAPEEINKRLQTLEPIALRLEMKEAVNDCIIINDYYNSDINSLSIALNFLSLQSKNKKKTLILSDILQSGKQPGVLYNEVAKLIKRNKIDKLIGIGESISKYSHLFDGNCQTYFYKSVNEFLTTPLKPAFKQETILLKGARAFRFERISRFLQKKTHETVLQINMTAIEKNLNFFKSLLPDEVKIMVMVKAFSYGNGGYEIANWLQYHRVDYLGVAFVDEGVALRKAGIYLPIMVMNPELSAFEEMIEYNLEPEIYNFDVLRYFYQEIKRQKILHYPIHIKINTGMNRLGFDRNEIDNLMIELKSYPEIKVKSVFSHLASADDPNDDNFTYNQIKLFETLSKKIETTLGHSVIKHILNSHGILRFPQYSFDMVRLGIGLYGFLNMDQDKLENVSTLKTVVLQVRRVTYGEAVGYNRRGKINKTTKIAIVPIGYAHGYSRRLGNGVGKMLIKGKLVPTIGNINMDMTAIDITGLDVKVGDEVIVFGKKFTAADLAQLIDTIPYEVITSVSARVKRIYYYD